ncbi:MAG: hypothetical protein HWE23_03285 [Rhodobacteraceae bacterium]|nr:hypothetical protein [Paracoccaceae bacterium]
MTLSFGALQNWVVSFSRDRASAFDVTYHYMCDVGSKVLAVAKIVLVNPNTNKQTTKQMVEIAQSECHGYSIIGLTARDGASLITNEMALSNSASAVFDLKSDIERILPAGVIVSAFGDPGRDALANALTVPVVGIAQSAARVAGANGRRFAIVTTTPDLVEAIKLRMASYVGGEQLTSVHLTRGDLEETMQSEELLADRLREAALTAIREDGVEAIVIGGGPLAVAGRRIAKDLAVPVVEPIPSAVQWLEELVQSRS